MQAPEDRTPAWFLLQAERLVRVKVPRGELVELDTGARTKESVLVWQFQVHSHDIGFRVVVDDVVCREYQERHQSSGTLVDGILEDVPLSAKVLMQWDNTYSRLRAKEISYRMGWVSPTALHAAREATNEYNIKYNNELFRLRSDSTLDAPLPAPSPKNHHSHDVVLQHLENAIVETIATFMAEPSKPLQAGAARSLIIAIESMLRSGVNVQNTDAYDVWPEGRYFGFLVHTRDVLRDDAHVVADAQLFTPPTYMRYLGWGRARAFIFYALNRNLLHRALENLIKRTSIVDKFYDRNEAFLGLYDRAKKAVDLLSALHGVTFALVPLQDNFGTIFSNFPPTLYQASPLVAFPSSSTEFSTPIVGDLLEFRGSSSLEAFNSIHECTPVRYLLVSTPFYDIKINRSSSHRILLEDCDPNKSIIALQMRVTGSSAISAVLQYHSTTLAPPVKLEISDNWTEITLRFKPLRPEGLSLLLDNRDSMVWSSHVSYRVTSVTPNEYCNAWRSTMDMADAICWKHVIQRDLDTYNSFDEPENFSTLQENPGHTEEPLLSYTDFSILPWLGVRSGSSCGQCMEQFTLFRRPQACAMCMKQCCINCTRHVIPIREKHECVCDRCYLKALDKQLAEQQQKANGKQNNSALETLRQNPSMDKYFKMLAFGVPASAIGQKMQQDYIDADLIHIFVAALDPSTEARASHATKDKSTSGRELQRKKSTLRKLHWTALDGAKVNVQASIWHRQTNKRLKAPVVLSSTDMERLIELFGDSTATKELKRNTKKGFSALDSRRSNNINIALSRFKSFGSVDSIISALRTCDLTKLSLDILQALDEIAPTPAETKRYTNFRGKVTDAAESFLIEMTKLPRVAEKIKSLIFVATFPSAMAQIRSQIECITLASRDVLKSERLPRCFEIILALGNVLNEGTEQADASGVTIASLLKLSETRSVDQSLTLLQFLMQLIHNRGELDLFEIAEEFSAVESARRYSNVICHSQFVQMQKGLANLKYEIKEERLQQSVAAQKAQALAQRQANSMLFRQKSELPPRFHSGTPQSFSRKASVNASNGESAQESRQALLLAIQKKAQRIDNESAGNIAIPARQTMLSQIRQNNAEAAERKATEVEPRAALFAAIRQRKSVSAESDVDSASHTTSKAELPTVSSSNPRVAMLAAIRSRNHESSADSVAEQSLSNKAGNSKVIEKGEQSSVNDTEASESKALPTNPRAVLLAAIRSKNAEGTAPENSANSNAVEKLNRKTSPSTAAIQESTPRPHAALLSEIRNKPKSKAGQDTASRADTLQQELVAPIAQVASFPFITVMEQYASNIADDLAKLKDDIEVMAEVWNQVALYLGESSAVASDYVFGLLHRFVMDFKVAYNILIAKGHLSLYSHNGFFVHVGDSIATTFGPAIVLAVRHGGGKIEVKFPWANSAFLHPSCILHKGDEVICRAFGAGIVTETRYGSGLLRIRFPFGYGILRVEEILYKDATSSKVPLVVRLGDPVHTPFGSAEVLSIKSLAGVLQTFYQDPSTPAIICAFNPKYGHYHVHSRYVSFAWMQ